MGDVHDTDALPKHILICDNEHNNPEFDWTKREGRNSIDHIISHAIQISTWMSLMFDHLSPSLSIASWIGSLANGLWSLGHHSTAIDKITSARDASFVIDSLNKLIYTSPLKLKVHSFITWSFGLPMTFKRFFMIRVIPSSEADDNLPS